MLAALLFAAAGLAACGDDDGSGNGIAGTEWCGSHIVLMITDEGVEEARAAFIGFAFSRDGRSCTVETSVAGLLAANRVTEYVIYSPDTHSVILTDSEDSAYPEYHGVIEGECMQVRCCKGTGAAGDVVKLFRRR